MRTEPRHFLILWSVDSEHKKDWRLQCFIQTDYRWSGVLALAGSQGFADEPSMQPAPPWIADRIATISPEPDGIHSDQFPVYSREQARRLGAAVEEAMRATPHIIGAVMDYHAVRFAAFLAGAIGPVLVQLAKGDGDDYEIYDDEDDEGGEEWKGGRRPLVMA